MLFAGALAAGTRMLNTDSDLGRHLALGNYMLSAHQVPTHNLLSFRKPGDSRPPYEWLSELLFALAYRLLDLDGVVLLSALAIASAFLLVYLDSVQRSAAPLLSLFVTLWAAAASSLHWVARPHLFSFLLFALWLAMLDRLRRGDRQPLWQFPALMLVWANTHGGFIFGFLAYAAYLAGWLVQFWRGREDRRLGGNLLIIGGASLLASVLTPDLWGNWVATLNNRSSFVLSHTVETMPINLSLPGVWPFLFLLAFALVLMLLRGKQLTPAHVILLGGLALASFAMARNIPFFVIAAAPLCTVWLAQFLVRIPVAAKIEEGFARIDQELHGFLWSALAVVLACGFFLFHLRSTQTTVFHWDPRVMPVAAVAWLEHHPQQGQMFNDINWGGYLTFMLWPKQRVFVDSQTDFYGEPFMRQYVAILGAADAWDTELRQYNIGWLLLPPSAPLAGAASHDPGWRVAYQDTTAVILVRR